jgi:hypothetical protein
MIGLIFVGLICIFSGSLMCYMGVDMIVSAPELSGWDAIGSFAGGIGIVILGTAFFVFFSMLGKMAIDMVKEKLQ